MARGDDKTQKTHMTCTMHQNAHNASHCALPTINARMTPSLLVQPWCSECSSLDCLSRLSLRVAGGAEIGHSSVLMCTLCYHKSAGMHNIVIEHGVGTHQFVPFECPLWMLCLVPWDAKQFQVQNSGHGSDSWTQSRMKSCLWQVGSLLEVANAKLFMKP